MKLSEFDSDYLRQSEDAAEKSYEKAMEKSKDLKPFITREEAEKIYGYQIINEWIAKKLIIEIKNGDSVIFDRIQLQLASKTE